MGKTKSETEKLNQTQGSGTTVHPALGLQCRGKLFPLDSNTLAALRNKYAEVKQNILDEISMISKKCFIK